MSKLTKTLRAVALVGAVALPVAASAWWGPWGGGPWGGGGPWDGMSDGWGDGNMTFSMGGRGSGYGRGYGYPNYYGYPGYGYGGYPGYGYGGYPGYYGGGYPGWGGYGYAPPPYGYAPPAPQGQNQSNK